MNNVKKKAMLGKVSTRHHWPKCHYGSLLPHKANENAVAGSVARSIPAKVDVRRDDAAAVTTHDLHRNTGSPLQTSANIATVPGETKWDLRIDALVTTD